MPNERVIDPALNALTEFGAISRSYRASDARDAILTCLGCRSAIGCGISVANTAECSGVPGSSLRDVLKKLVKANVLATSVEYTGQRGRPDFIYEIAETPVGNALKAALVEPQTCNLIDGSV